MSNNRKAAIARLQKYLAPTPLRIVGVDGRGELLTNKGATYSFQAPSRVGIYPKVI